MKKLVMLSLVFLICNSNIFSQNDTCYVDYYTILDMSYCEDPYFQNNSAILNGEWEEFASRLLEYYQDSDSTISAISIYGVNPFKKFKFITVSLLRVEENSNVYKEEELTPCEAEEKYGCKYQ